MKRWCVWSPIFTPPEDGARFVVEDGLTKAEAEAAAVRRNELAEKHHAKRCVVVFRFDPRVEHIDALLGVALDGDHARCVDRDSLAHVVTAFTFATMS